MYCSLLVHVNTLTNEPYCKVLPKIIICAPELNKVLTALERHEGEELMTEFLGELSLEVFSSVD